MVHRTAVAVWLVIFHLATAFPARADPIEDAAAIVSQLSPIGPAIGPLIDRAIAKGDKALADRLQQLHTIIQEALATADAIAQRRIGDVDERLSARLTQLRVTVDQSLVQLQRLIRGDIEVADTALQARIAQLQADVGNVVAAVDFVAVDPLVSVGPNGLSVYRQVGDMTVLSITGMGLRKQDTQPVVGIRPFDDDRACFTASDSGCAPVNIRTSTMSLLTVGIPNNGISSPITDYKLYLKLRRGYKHAWLSWLLPDSWNASYATPSVPLRVCALERLTIEGTLTASGEIWERDVVPWSRVGGREAYVECPKGSGGTPLSVCPKGYNDWDVDTTRGHEASGLDVDGCGGEGPIPEQRNCSWAGACYAIWCAADHSDRGRNVSAINARVHLRRRKATDACGTTSAAAEPLLYRDGESEPVKGLTFNRSEAVGACEESGLTKAPTFKASVVVRSPAGVVVDDELVAGFPKTYLRDSLTLLLEPDGVLRSLLKPSCHWWYDPAVQTAKN